MHLHRAAATEHALCRVVIRVGGGDGGGSDRVGEREGLRCKCLDRLRHPRHVADEDGAPGHAVKPRPLLHQPDGHRRPPRQESVDDRVGHVDDVLDRHEPSFRLVVECRERLTDGCLHDRHERRGHHHRHQNVDGADDPRDGRLKHVPSPTSSVQSQRARGRGRSSSPISHDLAQPAAKRAVEKLKLLHLLDLVA
eukprot:6174890-Pleurochrysis_carterae.AAC.2